MKTGYLIRVPIGNTSNLKDYLKRNRIFWGTSATDFGTDGISGLFFADLTEHEALKMKLSVPCVIAKTGHVIYTDKEDDQNEIYF